jgi:hypothetical protein
MAETGGSGHAGSVGSCGDALAHVGLVSSGDAYALGSRGGARALCHMGMDRRVDPLSLECTSVHGLGPTRECAWVGWCDWLGQLGSWLVWAMYSV